MGFVNPTKPRGVIQGVPDKAADSVPDFWEDTVPASFRMYNWIGAMSSNNSPSETAFDPGFDPIPLIPEEHAMDENLASRYALANSPGEVVQISNQINRELADRKLISDSGAMGYLATALAGGLDPISFIPVGGALYKTFRTGGSILKSALVTGAAGGLAVSAQEALLMHEQQTRTFGEASADVTGAVFLSAILGGGARAFSSAVSRSSLKSLEAGIVRDMEIDAPNSGGGSIGARSEEHTSELQSH